MSVPPFFSRGAKGVNTHPLEEGLGSTIAVTALNREVIERITYTDAYGTPAFWTAGGAPLAASATDTRFLFTGREHLLPGSSGVDSATAGPGGRDERERASQWNREHGLYDYRNRTYSPTLGRFLQTDPIRFDAGDVNLYRYVANNPVNWVDPEGLFSFGDIAKRLLFISAINAINATIVELAAGKGCVHKCCKIKDCLNCFAGLGAAAVVPFGIINSLNPFAAITWGSRLAKAHQDCQERCRKNCE